MNVINYKQLQCETCGETTSHVEVDSFENGEIGKKFQCEICGPYRDEGMVQPKSTLEIRDTLTADDWYDDNRPRWNEKWVSFAEYQKKEDEYKALVDRLGQFNEYLNSRSPIQMDANWEVLTIRGEFQRRFSEFFIVEKCEGGQKKK